MNLGLENFLWQFRRWLIAIALIIPVALILTVFAIWCHHKLEQAAQAQAEQLKIQQEESNRVAQAAAQQAQAQLEESNRLAKIQEAELQKQAAIQEEENRKQAIEKAAADLKAYQERYLMSVEQAQNTSASRLVVVTADQNQPDADLTQTISAMANRAGFSIINDLLKPEFISDGLFDRAFNGEFDSLDQLGLTNDCEFIVLCQFTTTITLKPPLFEENEANGKLQIRLFRVRNGKLISSKEYNTDALAFDPAKAVALVRKNFISLLTTNSFPFQIAPK